MVMISLMKLGIIAFCFLTFTMAEDEKKCSLQNIESTLLEDLESERPNITSYWLFTVSNNCLIQFWSNKEAKKGFNVTQDNSSTQCETAKISTSSGRESVNIQIFAKNNQIFEIMAKTFKRENLLNLSKDEFQLDSILKMTNDDLSLEPLSCYLIPSTNKSFTVCIFYNSTENVLFSAIYDSDGKFTTLNPVLDILNQTETLASFFTSNFSSVSFHLDEFHQQLSVYLSNAEGKVLILQNKRLAETFTLMFKSFATMALLFNDLVPISSFESFSTRFDAFTSMICFPNICKWYVIPIVANSSSHICFNEIQWNQEPYFKKVGLIFNDFEYEISKWESSDWIIIFKSYGSVFITGLILTAAFFLAIGIAYCFIAIIKCVKSAFRHASAHESQPTSETRDPEISMHSSNISRRQQQYVTRTVVVEQNNEEIGN